MKTLNVCTTIFLFLFLFVGTQFVLGEDLFIPNDTSVGTWDPVNMIYTLTMDVDRTIQIVQHNMTLDGAGHTMTGSGPGSGPGVQLPYSMGVTIKNLNVQGFEYGISLYYANGNALIGNTTNSNLYHGIRLWASDNNDLRDNSASNNWLGIYLNYNCNNNSLTNNTADTNGLGINVVGSSNILTGNTSANNTYGIHVRGSSNILTGNTSSNNTYGIFFLDSDSNQVYNNNFIDNGTQAYVDSGSGNIFHLPEPMGGNYWSDYTGVDSDGDGFGDTPYTFTGGRDDLPWVSQNGWAPGTTPQGTDVVVEPPDPATGETPVTLTFDEVTTAGMSSLTISGQGQPPPSGFKLGAPPTYYEITTTAEFSGSITVCIDYSGIGFGNESKLKLMHWEGGIWVDTTSSLDEVNDIICGTVTALSPFAIFEESQPPVVGEITTPIDPVEVNTDIGVSADFTDSDVLDTHTADWDWGDGDTSPGAVTEDNGSGTVSGSHKYTSAGVYTITLTVTDNHGAFGEAVSDYVVVYDPSAGFVTGGGWIDSPAGAYADDPALTGKANFGFVSKYQKGAKTPSGQTEFNFSVADMNFHSEEYQWLVVAGAKAKFKGDGTINGLGNYGFMLSAVDAALTPSTDVDLFRIKIWDKDNGDSVVYDNQMDDVDNTDASTEIGGGSIVIHEGGATAAPALTIATTSEPQLDQNYPNPFNPETWIPYQLKEGADVTVTIYSATGQLVRRLDLGYRNPGSYTSMEKAVHWNGTNEHGERVSSGLYFYTIQAGEFMATKKMILAQ